MPHYLKQKCFEMLLKSNVNVEIWQRAAECCKPNAWYFLQSYSLKLWFTCKVKMLHKIFPKMLA